MAGRELQPSAGSGALSAGVTRPASAPSPPQGPLAPRPSWERQPARAGLRRAARDKPPRAAAAAGAGADGRGKPAREGRRERPPVAGGGDTAGFVLGWGLAPGRGRRALRTGPQVVVWGACGGPRGRRRGLEAAAMDDF